MSPQKYLTELENEKTDTFEDFRTMRNNLVLMTHRRADILASVNILSQVTNLKFCKKHIIVINKRAEYLTENPILDN